MQTELIDKVETFKDNVLSKISNRDIVSFKLGDISFDNNISVKGSNLTLPAINKILSTVRVKNNFIDYKQKLSNEEWSHIESTLKTANSNAEFWAKKITNTDGSSSIVKLYAKNKKDENLVDLKDYKKVFGDYFDMITLALKGTTKEYDLNMSYFDDNSETVTMRFIDKSSKVDVLNNLTDMWKMGNNLSFNMLEYNSAPFFERLICTNGMVAQNLGFKTNIRNDSFNVERIQNEINKLLIRGEDKYSSMLMENVQHLRRTDISIREYFTYKNFFENKNYNDKYNHIIAKLFNDNDLFKSYGVDINAQSDKWLSTATSGRNAYDFLNDLTWIASHTDKSRLDKDDAFELQRKVSDLFFQDKFDLEDIAPKVNIKLGKVITTNN